MARREFKIENEIVYNQTSPIRWIWSHFWHYKLFTITLVGGMLLAQTANTLIRTTVGSAFNIVLAENATINALVPIILTFVALIIFRFIGDVGGSWSSEFLGSRIERDARDELYLSLLGKSLTFHNRQRVGDIMARATDDVRQLNSMVAPGINLILDSSFGTLLPFVFIAGIAPQLLLAPTLFLIAFIIALRHYMKELDPVAGAMRFRFGAMSATLNEAIAGIEVVKSTAQEEQEKKKFTNRARTYREYFVKQGQIQARYLPPLILGLSLSLALLHGLYLFQLERINIGQLVAFIGLMFQFRFPTFISIFTFALVQQGIAGAERLLEIMQQETELDENESGYQEKMRGALAFENVTFGYNGKEILKNVTFQANPGETVAIVGQTGSGKTTLTNLVTRTYDVGDGRVIIDGTDVREWQLDALRSQISTIEQDIFLFSRSITDNIGFGLGEGVDVAMIENAAKGAQAHDFILGFKDGYGTVIGERGVTLSGGQRQRLAIARALLTDPRILILDDATSAIDSATEDQIQSAINRVLEGRTTLLITHRLSQIRRADKVLVLADGKIAAQGTHDELMQHSDLYQRIFMRFDE